MEMTDEGATSATTMTGVPSLPDPVFAVHRGSMTLITTTDSITVHDGQRRLANGGSDITGYELQRGTAPVVRWVYEARQT